MTASLSGFSAAQGLFPPARCIPSWLFCSAEIILTGQMHLYLAFLFHRDYFDRPDASLACSFSPQGLFPPGQMHLYPALLLHRDYFGRLNSSLLSSFSPQGLFPPVRCISILLFCSAGIISTGQMHLYLAVFFHRDYFDPVRYVPLAESISASPFRQISGLYTQALKEKKDA